jgi:hypothetical protein
MGRERPLTATADMRFGFTNSGAFILAMQNNDGGWGYAGGASWTEPTVYALLAGKVAGSPSENTKRGMLWLAGLQRSDGGWPPRLSVDQSTWVTALAVMILADSAESTLLRRGVEWLLDMTGKEATFLFRLRLKLLGTPTEDAGIKGWPWFPETAAWVTPTALTILALQKVSRAQPRPDLETRIEMGRKYLFARMCRDGGWNHGSTRALGYEAGSYPETTGLALLALHGVQSPDLSRSLATAERHLRTCRSAQGLSWLRLGLLAHGRDCEGVPAEKPPCRTVLDSALCILAEAGAKGRNVFLE